MMADTSETWDEDFEPSNEPIKVPSNILAVSDSVHSETQAARQLSQVVSSIRNELLRLSEDDLVSKDPFLTAKAVALVHASVEDKDDAFYSSPVWQRYRDADFKIEGRNLEQVLEFARKCLASLR